MTLFSLFPWRPPPLSIYGCFWSVIHITAPRVPHPDDHLSLLALGFLALPWACSALCFVLLQISLPVFSWFPEASFLPSRRRDHSEPRCPSVRCRPYRCLSASEIPSCSLSFLKSKIKVQEARQAMFLPDVGHSQVWSQYTWGPI